MLAGKLSFRSSALMAGTAAAIVCCTVSTAAFSAERLQLTIAAGHPEIFLWVKHAKETFIPTLDAELAKTGEIEIEWNEAYGGTIARLGSEVEALSHGLVDVAVTAAAFNLDTLGILTVSYALPFGPTDARDVTEAVEAAIENTPGALEMLEEQLGLVYVGGGFSIPNYGIGATKAIETLADIEGLKISGAGPNLGWLRGSGAVGVQGSFVSFYNDIQVGVVDGFIGWQSAAVPARLYEVAPHWNQVDMGAHFAGFMAVSKMRWDTFSDDTKQAFHTAAKAFSDAFHAEQEVVTEAAERTFADNGGKVHLMNAEDRATWISALPNPAVDWLGAGEARGEPAREMLFNYATAIAAQGFTYDRDFVAELE